MKRQIVSAFLLVVSSFVGATLACAQADYCQQYAGRPLYDEAIDAVAKALQYERHELCSLSRLADIFIQPSVRYNEEHQPVDHLSVSLHYGEYTCVYFVRNEDQEITDKTCFGSW